MPRLFDFDPLSDANLVDAVRAQARWQDPCDIDERDGLLLVAGSTRFPAAYLNCAIRVDAGLAPGQLVDRATTFFEARGRGFTMITRASSDADVEAALLEDAQFQLHYESPCMRVERPVVVPATPDGVRLEPMTEARHIADARRVHAQAYPLLGMPEKEVLKLFAHPQRVLGTGVIGCVAYREHEPVASALALASDGVAGVYWVGTAPAAHRLGLASLCTAWVTQRSFDQGARSVNLQASPMGAPVYTRLGFAVFDRMRWFGRRSPNRA